MIRRKHIPKHFRVIVRAPCLLSELIKAKGWHPSTPLPYQSYVTWKPPRDDLHLLQDLMLACLRVGPWPTRETFGQPRDEVDGLDCVPNNDLTVWLESNIEGLFFIVRDSDDNYRVWFKRETDAVLFDLAHR